MSKYYIHNGDCGTERVFKIIGTKWTPKIIELIVQNRELTFTDFKTSLPGITDSMLSRQINRLLEQQIIKKSPNGTFSFTNQGNDLLPVMKQIQILAKECGYHSSSSNSSLEYMGKLIGSKWKSRIIWIIYNNEVIRFNALKNSIEGISHKILITQLNDLIENNFISKIDYCEKNPKVEYRLTEKGKQIYFVIQELADWCLKYEIIKPTISINY